MIQRIPAHTAPGAKPYIWRDPNRLTRQQLDALAAHDAHIAALNGDLPPARPHVTEARRTFGEARRQGLSVRDAAELAGVSYRTGVSYEQRRHAARRRR